MAQHIEQISNQQRSIPVQDPVASPPIRPVRVQSNETIVIDDDEEDDIDCPRNCKAPDVLVVEKSPDHSMVRDKPGDKPEAISQDKNIVSSYLLIPRELTHYHRDAIQNVLLSRW